MTGQTPLLSRAECEALIAACQDDRKAGPDEAANLARMLICSYRKADMADPEMFATGLAANFAQYPASIGKQVADPVKGLPSRLKFPPTIAEISEALASAMARRKSIAQRAEWMLKERERRDAEAKREAKIKAISPERRAELVEQLRKAVTLADETTA